jgi:hypothetical protein
MRRSNLQGFSLITIAFKVRSQNLETVDSHGDCNPITEF